MNQFSLRFPERLEKHYAEFTKQVCFSHFRMYQPLLIIISLTLSITFVLHSQLINGIAIGIAAVVFIIQIPIVCKSKDNHKICSVFAINNVICTGLQLFVDNNQASENNQYVQACLITLINITLLEHYDFVWNAFTLTIIIAIRITYIILYLKFDVFAGLYLASSFYIYILLYRKALITRTLYLRYENEKQIKTILDSYLEDIYVHFRFDSNQFKFELKYSNQLAQRMIGMCNQKDLHDFLENYQVLDESQNQYNAKKLKSFTAICKPLSLGQFLYDKFILSKPEGKQSLKLTILNHKSDLIYKISCYTFPLLHQEVVMIIKYQEEAYQEDFELQVKKQEIKLLQYQLNKVNERTKKQLTQLSVLVNDNISDEFPLANQKEIYSQVISNTKTSLILDAISIYYIKKLKDIGVETFELRDLINESLAIMYPIFVTYQKNVIFENQESYQITSQSNVVRFLFQSLLYVSLIQKDHRIITLKLNCLKKQGIVQLNYYIEGLNSMDFIKQNTFILKMVYKGLNLVGPRAEIIAFCESSDEQASFSGSYFQIQIYSDLEAVFKCVV